MAFGRCCRRRGLDRPVSRPSWRPDCGAPRLAGRPRRCQRRPRSFDRESLLGRRIARIIPGQMPSSLATYLRYRALVKNLVLKDLKLKYRGSIFGIAWSLLHPLLLLSVYTLAFRYIVRIQM